MGLPFTDRFAAGLELGCALAAYRDRDDVMVLALPRGGVPVAIKVAASLRAPLDLLPVRKLGVPAHRELAMGAIASGGPRVLNREIIVALGISAAEIERITALERQELARRERAYHAGRRRAALAGRCLVLVDDGIATGATMQSAVAALRTQRPARIVVAAPVAPAETVDLLRTEVDEVVCLHMQKHFIAIGCWYLRFEQLSDRQVTELMYPRSQAQDRHGVIAERAEPHDVVIH